MNPPQTHLRPLLTGKIRLVCLLGMTLFGVACGRYDGGDSIPASGNGGNFVGAPSGLSEAEQVAAFEASVYPVLRERTCKNCHTAAGSAPFDLADSSSTTAYYSIINGQKVDFVNPSDSRLVRRLNRDSHHCWSDCDLDGAAMLSAIQDWVAEIEARGGSSEGGGEQVETAGTLVSSEVGAGEGEIIENGERYEANVIARWLFDEGVGETVARDTSGIAPAMDLSLRDDVDLMDSYGIDLRADVAIGSFDTGYKLYDRIADPFQGSGEYSVEVWVVAANTNQSADIIQYRGRSGTNNFKIRQRLYQYDFRNVSLASGINERNGTPELLTYDQDRDLQAGLQHAVLTFDRLLGRRIYVNGAYTDDDDDFGGSQLWNWEREGRLIIGQGGNNGWVGQVRMVAIHNAALTRQQIEQNYLAGVGLRTRLNFDISDWAGDGAKVEMSLTQLDDESYLLCQPTIVDAPTGLRVRGLRVKINGTIYDQGQAFTRVNSVVGSDRQQLTNHCTLVPRPETPPPGGDTFQIAFEGLGGAADGYSWGDPGTIDYNYDDVDPVPATGLREFSRVNESMAEITGVDAGTAAIDDTYRALLQQLPSDYDVRSFVTAHQVGVAKLGLAYCEELVDTAAASQDPGASFFAVTSFDFSAVPSAAFASESLIREITDPLAEQVIGNLGVSSLPTVPEVELELRTLLESLRDNCTTCDAEYTRSAVKGACMAVLASGAVTLH